MATQRGGFREAWSHRRWRVLLVATGVSGIGDWLYLTAFAVWLYDRTGSAAWLGGVVTARMLVYVSLGPIGGAIAARARRTRLMVGLDIARVVVMAILAVIVAADWSPLLGAVVVLAAAALTTPYRPALAAATPHVVPESALAAANGAEAVVGQIAVFAGPATAAVILGFGSPGAAIAVNAATFALAAALMARVGDLGGGSGNAVEAAAETAEERGIIGEIAIGWSTLIHTPGLFILNALIVLTLFTFGAEGVLHVIAAEEQLGRGAEFLGALTAAIGVGGLVVAPFAGRIAGSSKPGPWLVACAILQGAPLLALGHITSPALALGVLAVEGVGMIVFEVLAITLLQRLAGDRLPQVFGIQDSLTAVAQLLGGVGAAVLMAKAGLSVACAVGGGVLVAFGVMFAPALMRCGRLAAERVADLAPYIDELLTLGLFDGASRAAVESVAAAIVPEQVETGTVVVEEGHPADDLFVIRLGSFSAATRAHGTLRLMSPGDWFGEIGVLEARPRTATVVAETRGELWRIPGGAFLEALSELTVLPDPVRRHVTARHALSSTGVEPRGGPAHDVTVSG